jgi:hypothetical protein
MTQVKILQHHIDLGERGNAFHCPIALALKEQFGFAEVSVGMHIYADHEKLCDTTLGALYFIQCFDRRGAVTPTVFDFPF